MAEKLVILEKFRYLHEAQAIQMHLEAEGIPSFIHDGELLNANPLLGIAVGYIKLRVPESALTEARRVLNEKPMPPPSPANDEFFDEEFDDTMCLSCGQTLVEGESTCSQCGWSYADDEESDDPSAAK